MNLDFSSASVLITGDVMLDRYWFGDATRISPEAPVPVVHVSKTREVPGGAANVSVNIANLGAKTCLLSIVGNDDSGQQLESLLRRKNVETAFIRNNEFQTTVKLRIIARGQQVVRADFEKKPDNKLLLPLIDMLEERLPNYKTIVFSDYAKGGLAHLQNMIQSAISKNKLVLVDPKGSDFSLYRGASLITPNRAEFAQVVGSWSCEDEFERKAFALCDKLEITALLVTRSEEGMSLFVDNKHIYIPAQAREVFDVSGAGDTVIATMAVALGSGYSFENAARFANYTAGIVVGKFGTTPITLEEIDYA
jgi:D-glycero-beta-D-manno-heptose-7-phosphate kinase